MKISNTSLPYLIIVAMVTLFAALAHAENNQDWEERNVTLVGRVSHLEGVLRRLDVDQDEWVSTSQNSPVGAGDRLYTDADARVELILPNNTWIRMDGDTEMSLTALDEKFTDLSLTLGKVRLYNKSSTAEIKTTTPFGDIITPAGSHVDLDLYSDGVEIMALKHRAYFVHNRSNRRHEIRPTGGAIFADAHQVKASPPDVASGWSKWNKKLDDLWAMRAQTRGESATYLPHALHHDAYALDTHGRWDRVYYQGSYYRFWRPVHVHVGWTPFSSGFWQVRWQDNVWIPHEPFGYVTHHYGNWVFTAGHWYWAPPVTRVMINAGLPLFRIGLAWYPGRVAWLHAGAHVGWFPLAPFEPYYSHRHWGRRTHLVAKRGHLHHRRHNYKHRRHAVVIHKDHMYRGRNYRDARIKGTSRSVKIARFRTAPVFNRSTIKTHHNRPGIKRFDRRPTIRKHQHNRTREGRHDRWVNKRSEEARTVSRTRKSNAGRAERLNKPDTPRQRDRFQTNRIERTRDRVASKRFRAERWEKRNHSPSSNTRPAKEGARIQESSKASKSLKSERQTNRRPRRPQDIDTPKRARAERWEKRSHNKPANNRPANKTAQIQRRSNTSKSLKSERQTYRQRLTKARIRKEAVNQQTRARDAKRRPAIQPQTRTSQNRSPRKLNTNDSRNRSAQQRHQGRSYAPRGQAPQKWNGNRTHRSTNGDRRRARSRR